MKINLKLFLTTSFLTLTVWGQTIPSPGRPVADKRAFIIPSATPTNDGADVAVDIYYAKKNTPVSLWLQAAIVGSNGKTYIVPLRQLDKDVNVNPNGYYAKQVYSINYAEINKLLKKMFPKADLEIEGGTPLFVYARFQTGNSYQSHHQWGGVDRGGKVIMPQKLGTTASRRKKSAAIVSSMRPTELDIGIVIDKPLSLAFGSGLKVGGQIKSRVEGEGKYQITEEEFKQIQKKLFDLAKNPKKFKELAGKDWTLQVEDRYYKKDSNGQTVLGKDGMPIPDPMVDTYYDSDRHEAAEKDMAIRYRYTAGNNSGSWNFKPGLTEVDENGVAYRLEYGVDSVGSKPDAIKAFADSSHPFNFFDAIRTKISAKSQPSSFLQEAVKLTDYRYKFMLKNKDGLAIEVSIDAVDAEDLRSSRKKKARYYQIEMDIDHLATASTNIRSTQGSSGLMHIDPKSFEATFKNLNDKTDFLANGDIHREVDLASSGALRQAHAKDFTDATNVIAKLRQTLIGAQWIPGSQKYAHAAYLLGLVRPQDASESVKTVLKLENYKSKKIMYCKRLF